MMVTASVRMNVDRLQIKDVAQKMLDMSQVTEVFSVAGRYDLIAMVRFKSTEEVADTITEKIGSMTGITATETLIAFRTYSRHDLEHMFSLGE
jgi:DNA-binding Lrp family transcriptional regulator